MAYTRLTHAQDNRPQREQAFITRATHGRRALTKRRGAHRVPDFTDDIVGAAAAALAVAAQRGIGRHEGKWCAAVLTPLGVIASSLSAGRQSLRYHPR